MNRRRELGRGEGTLCYLEHLERLEVVARESDGEGARWRIA